MNIFARINNKIKRVAIKNFGPKRYCNICKISFRGKFIPIDSVYVEQLKEAGFPYSFEDGETLNHEEYTCPFCISVDRDRLYALYIEGHLKQTAGNKLLDIAPSKLRNFLQKNRLIEYRSADLFMKDVDDKVDVMDMHIYANDQFDIFICSHVLEHVLDDRKAMRELYRVLKPGGFGIAMVPIVLTLKDVDEDVSIIDPIERWRRFGQDDHVRLYSKNGFIDRLIEAGFHVNEITVKNYSDKEFALLGISRRSVLYIVTK